MKAKKLAAMVLSAAMAVSLAACGSSPGTSGDASGSSGLGLPMVQWIAKAHGGTISAESTQGQGSKFSFTFSSSLNLGTI